MPKKITGNGRKTSMIGRRACCCKHSINSKRDQGIVKPRPAAALALVRRHRLLRGEIDAEIIIYGRFGIYPSRRRRIVFQMVAKRTTEPFHSATPLRRACSESVKSPIISTSVAPPSFAYSSEPNCRPSRSGAIGALMALETGKLGQPAFQLRTHSRLD